MLQPGSIPRKKYEKPPRLAFKQMELIELFIDTIKMFGVPDEERFQTVDLYEEQSLYQVLLCLQTLARKVCNGHTQLLHVTGGGSRLVGRGSLSQS